MILMKTLDHKTLLHIIQYDPETGDFFWKSPRPKIQVGAKAGSLHYRGYINVCIDGKSYMGHRLAWFYMIGEWPSNQIDHINRNKSDNKFANLREATNGQNRANTKTTNKHGLKGVRLLPWMKKTGNCWQAQITHNKKVHYLGCYRTKEEAHFRYCKAATEFHKDFSNF